MSGGGNASAIQPVEGRGRAGKDYTQVTRQLSPEGSQAV